MAELRHRDDLHLARRLWHFTGVMAMVVLYFSLTRSQAIRVALEASALWVTLDFLRLQFPQLNSVLTKLFQPVMRESEKNHLAGSTYMFLGVTLIVCLYPREVVLLSLLFLGVADPIASTVGIRFGRDKLIGNKTLQGSLAAFFACLIISVVYLMAMRLMTERLVIVAILSALIGAISELIPVGKLDDNFTFPVISATLLTLVFELFGGLIS